MLPSIINNGTIEAWGLTVNEALECGTPVITTNAVGSAYDLIDESNGLIVKNNDVEDLRRALNHILVNSNLKYSKQLIMNNYNMNFSVKKMAKGFYNIVFE